MNTCIKCGRPIADGELFCAECSMNALPPELRNPAPAPKQHKQAPKPQAKNHAAKEPAPRHTAAWTPKPRTVIVLALLFVLSFGLLVWQLTDHQSQVVALRLWQDELESREDSLSRLEEENAAYAQRVSELESDLASATGELDAMQTDLADAQRSATQSEYDMTTQQAELDEANKTVASLETAVEDLQAENEILQEKADSLEEENSNLTKKGSFMDRYVVFVENDGSNLYHRYGCSHFAGKSFWAYSKRLAETHGYKACPHCN